MHLKAVRDDTRAIARNRPGIILGDVVAASSREAVRAVMRTAALPVIVEEVTWDATILPQNKEL